MDFSVVMSVYKNDNPLYFARALESITGLQTRKPTEIVLVVDGPIPEELDSVILLYQEKYSFFSIIRLPNNGGLGNALRIGVERSKYNLIARMDSDDVAASDRFEKQILFFEQNPDIDICGGNITEFIGDERNIVAHRNVPQSDSEIKAYLKKRCPLNHVTVMFKKDAVQGAGGYLDWFFNEDYYLWIRMYLHDAKMANLDTNLVNVRIGYDMYSRRGGKKYFQSEYKLQKYMWKNKVINTPLFIINTTKRFIVEIMLSTTIRGYVFKLFARDREKSH